MLGTLGMVASVFGDSHDPREATSPWQLLATDRAVAISRAIMTGLVFGLVVLLAFGLIIGLARPVLSAWGNWLVLTRLWLPLTRRLPWRPKRFLEDAYERGILRQTGAVYQFRHAHLRDHLARQYRTPRARAAQRV